MIMDKHVRKIKEELKDYNALFLDTISEFGLDRSDFTDEEYAEAISELKDEDAGMLVEDGILDSTFLILKTEKKNGLCFQ